MMKDTVKRSNKRTRLIVAVVIMLIIAAIHAFRVGTYLPKDWYLMYYYYASDIMVPFGFYFIACMIDTKFPFLRAWYTKALIMFVGCTITEVFHAFDLSILGQTFDYYDILMFAIGAGLAALVDKQLFERIIPNWKPVRY